MPPQNRTRPALADRLDPRLPISRRTFLAQLATVSAAALLAGHALPSRRDDFVQVNGWILKRSDLA